MTDHAAEARDVAAFNDANPVGTPVLFWPGARLGEGRPSRTQSAGGIALSHVTPTTRNPEQ